MRDRQLKLKARVQERSHQNTHKQGAVNLLRDQRKPYRHNGGNKRPERSVEIRHILHLLLRRKHRRGTGKRQQKHGRHKHLPPLFHLFHDFLSFLHLL